MGMIVAAVAEAMTVQRLSLSASRLRAAEAAMAECHLGGGPGVRRRRLSNALQMGGGRGRASFARQHVAKVLAILNVRAMSCWINMNIGARSLMDKPHCTSSERK